SVGGARRTQPVHRVHHQTPQGLGQQRDDRDHDGDREPGVDGDQPRGHNGEHPTGAGGGHPRLGVGQGHDDRPNEGDVRDQASGDRGGRGGADAVDEQVRDGPGDVGECEQGRESGGYDQRLDGASRRTVLYGGRRVVLRQGPHWRRTRGGRLLGGDRGGSRRGAA